MNKKNELPNVNLQKSSVIFMQLGLILAMLIVYIILEHESVYKPHTLAAYEPTDDPDDDQTIRDFVIEKKQKQKSISKKIEKKTQKQEPKPADKFETIKDTSPEKETPDVLAPTDTSEKEEVNLTVDAIGEVDPIEVPEVDFEFYKVEFAPEYPGCKGSKEEMKQCFNDKINKFVQRKFNADIAQEIGLSEGKKRINVQFIINKQGDIVDVKVRAPHKRLEKEARRVVNLLPKMKPARQGNGKARVKFNLPILFNIEE
ncbi:MAG TPA: energy transducer TonB [Flavobacteriaceae bacterium]|nr:energy transducer TonB [Flavobacteriaceae bacterium]HIP26385.1 energy transducer TonB [Flavobacteriaceae bacterium]